MERVATVLVAAALLASGCGDGGGAAPTGGSKSGLFVSMQDAAGNETVFRLGHGEAPSCGERLSALIEPGCPRLSIFFDVHGDVYDVLPELYVQGAYGFFIQSDGVVHARTVSDIAIDVADQQIVTGHYRMVLDEAPGRATDVWGRFALCAESGATLEPCRNM